MNNFSEELLLIFLIGVIASAGDIDLANNTTILLLLVLILFSGFDNSCSYYRNTSNFPFTT